MPKTFQNKRFYIAVLLLLAFQLLLNLVAIIQVEVLHSESLYSFINIFVVLLLFTGSAGFLWQAISTIYLAFTLALPIFYVLLAINQTGARLAAVIFLITYIVSTVFLLVSVLFNPLLLLGVLFNLVVIGLLIYLLRHPVP